MPFIPWHKNITPTLNENLHSSLDIAPTICDLLVIEKSNSFKGRSVIGKFDNTKYNYAEHMHRGPCDLKNKPIYLCIRSDQYKFIWKEFIYHDDENSIDREEFFDLQNDPEETKNLIEETKHQNTIAKMRELAEKRTREIRSEENMKLPGVL